MAWNSWTLPPVLLLAVLACRTPPPPPPAPPALPEFSAENAWRHLEELVAIGPRVPGTEGSAAARAYLRSQLEGLGLEVSERRLREGAEDEADTEAVEVDELLEVGEADAEAEHAPEPSFDFTHLSAVIPGERDDLFLLAAPYDTPSFETFDFVGANDGASGAAVLLELARVLAEAPLPYTVWITFVDGDAPAPGTEARMGLKGSRLWVRDLAEAGFLARTRMVLYLNQVGDADLRIPRDLLSHRVYRKILFAAAPRGGVGDFFPRDSAVEPLVTGHLAFIQAGMRRALAIADPSFGGDEAPGLYWHTEDDSLERCTPKSLGAAGRGTLAGLRDVAALLRKVDRFARSRVPAEPEISSEESSDEESLFDEGVTPLWEEVEPEPGAPPDAQEQSTEAVSP